MQTINDKTNELDPNAARLQELKSGLQEWLKAFPPDAPALVMTVYNAYEDVVECLDSLLATIPPQTPLIILDDASPDQRIPNLLEPLSHRRGFAYIRKPVNGGVVHSGNLAFEWCDPRDVVILNSDIVLPYGWLERLREAIYSSSSFATATPFTNNGAIYSIPYRNRPINFLPGNMTVHQVDDRVRQASGKLYPIIPSAITFCTYFKRSTLDVIGFYDEIFSPGYGEEVDFSQRVIVAGYSNILVDNLFVFHKGSRSFGTNPKKQQIQDSHEEIVVARYPWHPLYVQWLQKDNYHPLALAIERAAAAINGLRVAVDATSIVGYTTGTQLQTLELIRALAVSPDRERVGGYLAVIVRDELPLEQLLGVDKLVNEVFRVSQLQGLDKPTFDLVHRPFQIFKLDELQFLQRIARRLVVSYLDSIAFSNPSYFDPPTEWMEARSITRAVFTQADGIVFISQDAQSDALHQGLYMEESRRCVAYIGTDHHLHVSEPMPPSSAPDLAGQPYLLMLGTNFRHKNRAYAIKVLKELIERYDWPGHLVMAGPSVSWGGSNADEALERLHDPRLGARLHYLGGVSEGEKQWLLDHAALVLYPSSYEGFGLIPFEAAQAGVPVLSSRATSLAETLGDDIVSLPNFDPALGATLAWSLLSDPALAARQVESLKTRAAQFNWAQVAERSWAFYRQLLQQPARQALQEYDSLRDQAQLHELDLAYKKLEEWAGNLNQKVVATEGSRAYQVLSRLKLV